MLKRNKEVLLWLTEKELATLKNNAKKCRLSVQAYLRMLLSNIQPKEFPSPDCMDTLMLLRQISINMNQIAIKAHMTGSIQADAYWENSKRLQEVISELKKHIFNL